MKQGVGGLGGWEIKMEKINKTLLKRLELMSNKELLILARVYKIENRVNNTSTFQRNYNTILSELEKRKLLNYNGGRK